MKQYLLLLGVIFASPSLWSQNVVEYDSTFGQNGQTIFFNPNKAGTGILHQPDGKSIVFGDAKYGANLDRANLMVSRIKQNGQLDSTFNAVGSEITQVGINRLYTAVAGGLQPDGKFIIAGHGSLPAEYRHKTLLFRFLEHGSLDTSFGVMGKVVLENDSFGLYLSGYQLLEDSKMLVLVRSIFWGNTSYIYKPILYKLLPDGSPDPSFGNQGALDLSDRGMAEPNAMALSADGTIYVTGTDTSLLDTKIIIIRVHPDGITDPDFHFQLDLGNMLPDGYLTSLAVQPDGKILAGGEANLFTILLRLHPDGTLDSSFSRDGIALHKFGPVYSPIKQIALGPNGKILGHMGALQFCQFNANGTLDYTFDLDGKLIKAQDLDPMTAFTGVKFTIQPDQKILVCGTVNNRFSVIRLVNRYVE